MLTTLMATPDVLASLDARWFLAVQIAAALVLLWAIYRVGFAGSAVDEARTTVANLDRACKLVEPGPPASRADRDRANAVALERAVTRMASRRDARHAPKRPA